MGRAGSGWCWLFSVVFVILFYFIKPWGNVVEYIVGTIEMGLNTMVLVPKEGRVHKQVTNLPDLPGSGFSCIPEKSDYERLVGRSINFLKDERWGLDNMIPSCEMKVVDDPRWASGCVCIISMDWIKGQPLSEMRRLSANVGSQLAYFLERCTKMAEVTKKEAGYPVLPDLLGGVHRAHDEFRNFVVEDGSNKLYFVDMYPLAEISSWVARRKYSKVLRRAAERTACEEVVVAARVLASKIS